MRHLTFKALALLVFAPVTVSLASCGGQGHVAQSSDRNIVSINIKEGTLPDRIPIGGFNDAGIILLVQYSDSTTEEIPLTEDLIPERYRHYLNEEGYCTIKIVFRGFELTVSVLICETYTVNFYAYANGVPEYTLVDTQYILTGLDAVAPDVEQSVYGETLHYYFSGWDKNLTNIVFDMDIYAVYDSVPWYTVSFFNGASSLIDSQRIDEGENAVEPSEEVREMEGYDFVAWDRPYDHVTKDLEIYGIYCGVSSTPYPKYRYTLEFEDAEFVDESDPYNFSPESLIQYRDNSSGGKSIGFFRNPIEGTLRFTSERAGDATLTFMLAFAQTVTLSSAVEMKVNGVALNLNGMIVSPEDGEDEDLNFDSYFNWAPYEFSNVAIKEGENEITLRALQDGPNFDCVHVRSAENLGIVQTVFVPDPVLPLPKTNLNMRVGETLQLESEFEGVSYLSLDESLIAVSETGEVTALQSGSATIVALKDGYRPAKIYVEIAPPISELVVDEEYTVIGKVVAVNTKSIVIHDGTGAVVVYLNAAPSYEIGDVVEVSGKVVASRYTAGFVQFDSTCTIKRVDQVVGEIPGPVDLTAAIVDAWVAAYQAAENKESQFYKQDEMKLYKWTTTAVKNGNYDVIKADGSDVIIEPIYPDNYVYKFAEGKKYDVEGYFVGYRVTASGYSYAQIVLTKAEDVTPVGTVFVNGPKDVTVGSSLELSATIEQDGDAVVQWSLKEANMGQVVELTVDPANGNKVTVKGLAAGEVIVVATNGNFSFETKITVFAIAEVAISNITEAGKVYSVTGVVAALTSKGFVVSDGTGAIYVYLNAAPTVSVGDMVSVEGGVSAYNKVFQFSAIDKVEPVAVAKVEANIPNLPVAVDLTPEIVAGWKDGTAFPTTDVKLYKWTATVTKPDKYVMTNLEGCEIDIEPSNVPSDITLEVGKTYDLEAYFGGSRNDYAAVYITKAKEVVSEAGE